MAFQKGNKPWNKGLKGKRPYMKMEGLKIGQQKGVRHHNWKGDKASYSAIHYWVIRQLGKARFCSNNLLHKTARYHWANISGKYKRDINDYVSLCTKCHVKLDDNVNKSWLTRRGVA